MNEKHALRLLGELWSDVADPDFIWQVAALVLCLAVALLAARWWQRRRRSDASVDRLHAAGARLAFPLAGMLLVGIAIVAIKPIAHVNLLKLAQPLLGSLALVRGVVYVLRQAFPTAAWLGAWERILALLIWGWLALYITDTAPFVIEALEQVSFPVGKQRIDLWMIVHGALTVFLTVLAALWIAGIIENRLMGLQELDSSLAIVAVRMAKALLTVAAILLSLGLVGIDMTALSVFTGALGVGLGFGLQKIASNYVSGFIILLDRSIRIGNVIQVDAGVAGAVTQITTRYTVVRNPTGVEYIVPNETLVSGIVHNQSYSDSKVRLATTVSVAYGSDLDRVMALMKAAAAGLPRVLADPGPHVLLTRFADSGIDLELGFWIADPEQGTGNIRSEVNLALWRSFREEGIEIPFPQREIRLLGQGV